MELGKVPSSTEKGKDRKNSKEEEGDRFGRDKKGKQKEKNRPEKTEETGSASTREWTIFNGWTKWKSWKFSFSRNARIHGSRHRAGDCCHATPWRQQPRTAQARGTWMTRQHTEDRQLYNRTFPTSRAHRGSLSKRRELVLSSLPTRPPLFSPSLGPQSLTLRVSFPCICSPSVCIICSVTSLSLATTTWTPEHPFFSTLCYPNASSDITCVLGGGSFPVTAHGFSSKGVAAVRARRLFPSTISGVRAQFPSYLWVEN